LAKTVTHLQRGLSAIAEHLVYLPTCRVYMPGDQGGMADPLHDVQKQYYGVECNRLPISVASSIIIL